MTLGQMLLAVGDRVEWTYTTGCPPARGTVREVTGKEITFHWDDEPNRPDTWLKAWRMSRELRRIS